MLSRSHTGLLPALRSRLVVSAPVMDSVSPNIEKSSRPALAKSSSTASRSTDGSYSRLTNAVQPLPQESRDAVQSVSSIGSAPRALASLIRVRRTLPTVVSMNSRLPSALRLVSHTLAPDSSPTMPGRVSSFLPVGSRRS